VTATRVAVLTPPGTGAIATIELSGPRAWEFARTLFRPAGKPLPDVPELHRFWFGTLGEGAGDEVILAACGDAVEVHCHGGRRVVRWVVEQFLALGCVEGEPSRSDSVLDLLQRAPTLRTASVLLDQLHGAFDAAVRRVLDSPHLDGLHDLARFADIGRHLVEPWKVIVAGPPNVGKSSLVNALAGFQRTVVSAVAGTTRDAVSVPLTFDGWPVELTDTAGLRDAEGLEAEGIDRAKRVLAGADLVIWLIDATSPVFPPEGHVGLVVWNKADLAGCPGFAVSALTGHGVSELAAEIARRLVPDPPPHGAAVPYTPALAAAVETALAAGPAEATRLLRACLAAG
jgi:tRNA modification GTPase